uniref:Uncharacterized protein n=1 Tax=Arundo donax TaxID=35708 RepID=A0A0A8YK56_ARUDO
MQTLSRFLVLVLCVSNKSVMFKSCTT